MVNTAINGTNDAAVLSSAVVALAETNAALATSGTLAIADVDNPALFTAQTNVVGTNGTFSVTAAGAWSYTANAAFDGLNVGQSVSDTFTVAAVDGTATTVKVTINGTNDAAVLSSAVVALAETNAALATSGTLTITVVDNPALFTAQTNVAGTNGTFSVTAAGAWSYTANAAFDGLNVGQSVSDTFTVAAVDGTATTVKVTINGTNDAPIISVGTTATGAIAEQTGVTGSTLLDTATGAIRFNDIDLGTHTATITSVTATGVTNGLPASTTLLALLRTGAVTEQSGATAGSIGWTFSAADSTFDYLAAGETATLTYAVQLSDNSGGTALQNIAVTITGTNDAPTAAAVAASTQQNVIVKIAFVGADIDHADVLTYQVVTGPSLGTATVNADGTFTFDPGHAFDALATGEQQTVTFTYQATDKLGNL